MHIGKWLVIGCLGVVCASLRAATLTIVPTGTSSAAATEQDAPYSLVINYSQTGGNGKAWLTANASADLTITGIPAATITSMQVYMRSNKNSGSGEVDLRLNDQTLMAYSGRFSEWDDTGYSTAFLPFGVSGTWQVSPNDLLQLHIQASENSLYWQQVIIEYTPEPLSIGCVELRWVEDGEVQTDQLCEQVAGEGILLPDMDDNDRTMLYDGITYRFIGWTNQQTDNVSTMPYTALPRQRFYVNGSTTILYALYGSQTDTQLTTTNILQDGEYVLGIPSGEGTLVMPAGRVAKGVVPVHTETMGRQTDGQIVWPTSEVPEQLRYTLTVNGDSVTLFHAASNSYLGYNNSGSLSPSRRAWAWQAVANGTIVLYHSSSKSASSRSLIIKQLVNDDLDDAISTTVIAEAAAAWTAESERMACFLVTDMPLTASAKIYTTFPIHTPIAETMSDNRLTVKVWQNGQLFIRRGNQVYNLIGQPR